MLALRFLFTYKTDRLVRDVEKYRRANGLTGSIPGMVIDTNDEEILAVILASRMEYEYPCVLPPKFILCGPIIRPFAPIAQENPGLARWLARCPTVLVNLGSIAQFSPIIEREFAKAVRSILEVRGSAQVLWKLPRPASATSPSGVITDPMALEILSFFMAQDRLRTVTWLPVEPSCLLQSGHVKCVVHHGGANSYHEAIRFVFSPRWFLVLYPVINMSPLQCWNPPGYRTHLVRHVRLCPARRVPRYWLLGQSTTCTWCQWTRARSGRQAHPVH